MFPGAFDVLLLMALGIGYIVLYFAKREEKEMQFVGYIIGSVIIVLSAVYLVGKVWLQSKVCSGKLPYKGMMQRQMMRPGMVPNMPPKK